MGTTQPIRDKEDLRTFMAYYEEQQPHARNQALITMGLYTAMRISDILKLKWENVYDFEKKQYFEHIVLTEQKTKKSSLIAINPNLELALAKYQEEIHPNPSDYLFSKKNNPACHLCRSQAYRIVRTATKLMKDNSNISCHSLRKTFGYFAWKQGVSPVLLMDIYNHSSFTITKRYLGIRQDERDEIFRNMEY